MTKLLEHIKKINTPITLIIILLQITTIAFSQKIFVREIYYPVKKGEVIIEIRKKAINEIKSRLSDELGGYIMSQSIMKRGENDTVYYESFEQKTQSISLNYMKVFVDEEKELNEKLYIKARIELDDQQLNNELKNAGFTNKNELLQMVIAMMEANNIGSYEFKISQVANTVLSGFSTIQNQSDKTIINQLIVKNNGQLFDGDKCLNGTFEIIYTTGNYAFITINNGFLENSFQLYNSTKNKILEGNFKKGHKNGLWQEYSNGQLVSSISYSESSFHGLSSWYTTLANKPTLTVEYNKGIPQRKTIIENIHGQQIKKEGSIDKYENWDGMIISTDKESNTIEKAQYQNGLRHGEYHKYYPTGSIEKQGNYKKGKPVGEILTYYNNGKLKSSFEYIDNEEEPLNYKHFYENGNKKEIVTKLSNEQTKEETYYENGQLKSSGIYPPKNREAISYKHFYNNGILKKEKKIISDNRFIIESFYETGNKKEIENYIGNYIKDGVFKTFYSNGQIKEESNYINDCKEGTYKLFNNDGNPTELKTYKTIDGQVVLDGPIKKWLNGYCNMEGNYKNGKKNGVFITYYSSSTQAKKEEEYLYDILHGYVKEYFETGEQSAQKKYVNGLRNGEWYSITTGGEKEYLVYKNDQIISRKKTMANGQSTEEEYPLDGNPGIKKIYYPNDQLKTEYFVEGYSKDNKWISQKKCGLEKAYFDNGKIQHEKNWQNDKLNGISKTYNKNGIIKDITHYSIGKKEGQTIQFSENKIKSVGTYTKNKKTGEWFFFNADGTIKKVEYDQSGRESNQVIISNETEIKNLEKKHCKQLGITY